MDILVTFAVPDEAGPFRRRKLPGVRYRVTGMGPEAARTRFEKELEDRRPDWVLTCGFCGGLNPELSGTTVVADADAPGNLRERLEAMGVRPVRFHTAARVAGTAKEKARLFAQTGADAVEMESGVIREICRERGIPALTVRVVSDTAEEDLPVDFNKLMTAKGGVHFGRLALELATHPRAIPRLMKLQRRTSAAARALADTLEKLVAILPDPPGLDLQGG